MNELYVIRFISTGNLLTRRGSDMPLVFDSVYNAEMYISIYDLRRALFEIIVDPRRMPAMNELD